MDTQKPKSVDYCSMGKNIRKFRKEKGWTQDFLSEQCGITSTNLSHIERGKQNPVLRLL